MTPQGGLRERKKARTRAAIREHALRLFRELGYQATTVDQIAAAAEISRATFFRYFPTKEAVVFSDTVDTRMLDAFSRQPPDLAPIAAVRAAAREALSTFDAAGMAPLGEMTELMLTVPEIRARAMDEFAQMIGTLAAAVASRAGRPPDDIAVRAVAGAIIGVMMSVSLPWADRSSGQAAGDIFARVDSALALLESGLPL